MDEFFRQLFYYESKNEACLSPGYRFRPTEQELIICYLGPKVLDGSFSSKAIGEVDVYNCEPWELPERAKIKEDTEWYFFTQIDRKYPTSQSVKINRSTTAGYWKTCGTDGKIYNSITSQLIGMKKTLVFYKGRAPKGEKTNWIMYEFRLSENLSQSSKDEWVISRVLNKSGVVTAVVDGGVGKGTSCLSSEVSGLLPPLLNSSLYGFATSAEHESFYNDNISNVPSKAYEINCFSTASTTTSVVPHDQIFPPEPLTSSSFNPMSAFQVTLQENLELPFFYSSVAPPMHGGGGETSNSMCSSGEINLLPPSDNDMPCLTDLELDCIWSNYDQTDLGQL